jgi:hypothetical protein
MNTKIKLTPEIEQQIMAGIRAGGYAHVSAAAFGVPEQIFDTWLKWGTSKTAKDPYKRFARNIEQAKAQARLKAEMTAMENDPRFWLKNGPGRDLPDKPGWAAMVRPILTGNQQTVNLFMSPEFLQFMHTLRAVLAPFPDALKALTAAMDQPKPEIIQLPPQTEEAKSK